MEDMNFKLTTLSERVGKVESEMREVQKAVVDIKQSANTVAVITEKNGEIATKALLYAHEAADNSRQAVVLLEVTKGVGGVLAKHGPRVIAAIIGIVAYKGLIDGGLAEKLKQIFVVVT
jgi:hypothetical protein